MKYCIHNAAVVDDAINFVSDKSSSIEPKLEKHKVDDVVTVDKKHSNDKDLKKKRIIISSNQRL
jgi:hypothetical protein